MPLLAGRCFKASISKQRRASSSVSTYDDIVKMMCTLVTNIGRSSEIFYLSATPPPFIFPQLLSFKHVVIGPQKLRLLLHAHLINVGVLFSYRALRKAKSDRHGPPSSTNAVARHEPVQLPVDHAHTENKCNEAKRKARCTAQRI